MSSQKHVIDLILNEIPFNKGIAAAESAVKALGKTAKDVAVGISAAFAGVGVGLYSLNSAFGDLEEGFEKALSFQATARFRGLALEINSITNGIIDMNSALEIAQRGIRSGIDPETVKVIAKYSANLKLAGGQTVNLIDLNRKLLKAAESGQVDEEMRRYLHGKITDELKQQLNTQDKTLRVQRLRNILERELNDMTSKTGDVLNSKMTKLLGWIKAIKDESTGAAAIFKGLGKTAAAILAPLGAGMASIMHSPISGIVGTGIGALISGTAMAVAVKVVGAFTSTANQAADSVGITASKIMGYIDLIFNNISLFMESFLKGITGKTGFIAKIPKIALERMKKVGMSKKDFKNAIKWAHDIGEGFKAFSDAFFKHFDWEKMKKWIDGLIGMSEIKDPQMAGQKLGDFFGKTVAGLIETIQNTFTEENINKADKTIKKITAVFNSIYNLLLKWIPGLEEDIRKIDGGMQGKRFRINPKTGELEDITDKKRGVLGQVDIKPKPTSPVLQIPEPPIILHSDRIQPQELINPKTKKVLKLVPEFEIGKLMLDVKLQNSRREMAS